MNRCWLADNALGDRHNCSTPTSPGLSQISQQTVWRGNMKKQDKELWCFKRRTLAYFRAEKYLVWKGGKWEIEMALWASQKQEMTLWHWMTDDRWGSNSYKTLKWTPFLSDVAGKREDAKRQRSNELRRVSWQHHLPRRKEEMLWWLRWWSDKVLVTSLI